MLRLMRSPFRKDILSLLIVTIVIGALLANGIAAAANVYFGKAISSLVGDYGEYDLIIQVRDEVKMDAATQIQKVIDEQFPGARLKEGPTLTGKTNFFIALPDGNKNQQLYENLNKYFGSVPGGSSVGVMTEPRLTIRGVPDGAKAMVMDQIRRMEGVRFPFLDGSASIGVVLTSLDKANSVNEQVKKLLDQYQVLEIAFPVGAEPSNSVRLADDISARLQSEVGATFAQNVTLGGKDNDTAYLVGTMIELKRFLTAYATQMTITPAPGSRLINGAKLVLQGTAPQTLQPGTEMMKEHIQAVITGLNGNGSATAMITDGDAAQLSSLSVYLVDQNQVGPYVGEATYKNPRQELLTALGEVTKLVAQLPEMTQNAQNAATVALSVLNQYDTTLDSVDRTLQSVGTAGQAVQQATSGWDNLDTTTIRTQLQQSSQAMGNLIRTLQVLRLVDGQIGSTIDGLTVAQGNMQNLAQDLSMLDNVSEQARQAKVIIDTVVNNGNATLAQLRSFNSAKARTTVQNVQSNLQSVQQLNLPVVLAQLQYLQTAAPNLKDEDISHTTALLDKFIHGQVIPGARIQILIPGNLDTGKTQESIAKAVGHTNFSIYPTALGAIEPNQRGQVMQMLVEMKSILSAMMCLIIAFLSLTLDHSAMMAVLRRQRKEVRIVRTGWRAAVYRLTSIFTAPEHQYGMIVGAVMLSFLFVLGRASIPYVHWSLIPVIGAFIGALLAGKADKISPVSMDEVMAGEALGLAFVEIMREIVIPGARPGLLQAINKRRMQFR